MHEHHVQDFFIVCLNELSQISSRQQREQAIAYFSGYLCHYIGDSICHPFVYGRIQYDINNPSSQHHGLHAALENDIDALLLMKYKKKKPSQFNQAATICLNGQETQFYSRFLSACINKAYYPITYKNNFQVSPAMVHRSILAIRFGAEPYLILWAGNEAALSCWSPSSFANQWHPKNWSPTMWQIPAKA